MRADRTRGPDERQRRDTRRPCSCSACSTGEPWGRSDSVFAGPPAWLRDGGIVIAPATVTNFNTWYQVNGAITVAGKDLTEWAKWAAANDELPGGVCGTSISARALQRHVFGKDPAAGDPWGA